MTPLPTLRTTESRVQRFGFWPLQPMTIVMVQTIDVLAELGLSGPRGGLEFPGWMCFILSHCSSMSCWPGLVARGGLELPGWTRFILSHCSSMSCWPGIGPRGGLEFPGWMCFILSHCSNMNCWPGIGARGWEGTLQGGPGLRGRNWHSGWCRGVGTDTPGRTALYSARPKHFVPAFPSSRRLLPPQSSRGTWSAGVQ